MGMQHDGNRGILDLGRMVTAFYPAGGAGENDLGHGHNLNCFGAALIPADRAPVCA
jgi:hypothetical protein